MSQDKIKLKTVYLPVPVSEGLPEEDDSSDEFEFIRCSSCDGHDACVDFGCAIKAGIIDPTI